MTAVYSNRTVQIQITPSKNYNANSSHIKYSSGKINTYFIYGKDEVSSSSLEGGSNFISVNTYLHIGKIIVFYVLTAVVTAVD